MAPIICQEIVPGDVFDVKSEALIRMAPMLAPIMHRVDININYFFVPNRITWKDWEDYITGGLKGDYEGDLPTISIDDQLTDQFFLTGSLADYLGVPTIDLGNIAPPYQKISQLPFRAYQQIYNDYYIDQNLQTPLDLSLYDDPNNVGGDYTFLTQLQNTGWRKDYFTTCSPTAQKGPSISVPVEGEPVYKSVSEVKGVATSLTGIWDLESNNESLFATQGGTSQSATIENIQSLGGTIDIQDIRTSEALQKWLEIGMRGGTRYTERLQSSFGINPEDSRMQRAEWLGGGRQNMVISEVLNTGDPNQPQGEMTGHGISVGEEARFKRMFLEHGYVIGIMTVQPKTAYYQGMPRHFTREDNVEFYWPEFANLGEQEVKKKEVYFDESGATNDDLFGYQMQYAEFRFNQDCVSGQFKDILEYWHMGRKFAGPQALNSTFITSDPTQRIFAVPSEPSVLWCQTYHRIKAIRPMPYFAKPSIT